MKRHDFIDGITFLGFALILVNLAGNIGETAYLWGLIKPLWMMAMLDIGSVFCLIVGASVLFGKGDVWFKK